MKYVYDRVLSGQGTDDTDVPASSNIIQTSESNLDVVTFVGTINLDLNALDEFSFIDYKGDTIFAGVIREPQNGDTSTVTGFDYGVELGNIKIRKNFENMTPKEIQEDIITNYTSLTWVDNPNVIDGPAIELYPSQNKLANEIMDDMHKLLGTTHYVDISKNLTIEYEGEKVNPLVLQVGVNCNTDSDGWISDTSQLCKNVTVNGDNKETTETVFLSGTGSQTEFEITNPYVDITVEYPIGTELVPKLPDIQDGDYEIFKETKKIVFDVAPANGTDNIKVIYTYNLQTNFNIVEVTQAEVVAGQNPYHKVINADYIKEVKDAQNYAYKYKNKFGSPLREVTLFVDNVDLTKFRANQTIRVIDNIHTINGSNIDDLFIIKKIERSFGNSGSFMKLTVGDSTQFVFDRQAEVNQRVQDANETNPTAEIFNEGINTLADLELEIEYELTVDLLVATLPSNIFGYDMSREYVNEADHITPNDNFIYINEADYIALFDYADQKVYSTEEGKIIITEDGKYLQLDT